MLRKKGVIILSDREISDEMYEQMKKILAERGISQEQFIIAIMKMLEED